ncbi:MAG: CmcJ/NvfI family oxidoreductase [Gammaproteobacteria bacterium]|nr:CmcJ/NvfI family oxidoreductase [Gammaproteobacteria bacterium]
MSETVEPKNSSHVTVLGNYAHDRYRGFRMPPPESVTNVDERRSMYYKRSLNVHNARMIEPTPTVSSHGFTLVKHETQCSDMSDQEMVKSTLYKEYADLLQDLTGCTKVKVTQHQYRNGYGGLPEGDPRAARATPNGSEGIYGGIHSDVTPYSEPGWKPIVEERHFQVFNFWQSTDPVIPVQVMPLSLCDMNSIESGDMIYADSWNQTKNPRRLVSYRLAFSEEQKWYYYPSMQPDELLIFKQYDTMEDEPNRRCVYHGAIDLPSVPSDAPLRETIEVRLLALYEKEHNKVERVRSFQAQIPSEHPDGVASDWEVSYPDI